MRKRPSWRLYEVLTRLAGSQRIWRGMQKVLQRYLPGVSLRTMQRWTAELREQGLIKTRRWIDSRGYRHMNIYTITEFGLVDGGVAEGNGGSVEVISSNPKRVTHASPQLISKKSPSDVTRTQNGHFDNARHVVRNRGAGTESAGTEGVAMIGTDEEQFVLFSADLVDKRRGNTDTGKRPKETGSTRKGSSPVNRVMRYWLGGRKTLPPKRDIGIMGRVVKECLAHGACEKDLKDAIDALMRQGLDADWMQLAARFNLRKFRARKQRDYKQDPLYAHRPRPSTMNEQRAETLRQRHLRQLQTPVSPPSLPSLPGVGRQSVRAGRSRYASEWDLLREFEEDFAHERRFADEFTPGFLATSELDPIVRISRQEFRRQVAGRLGGNSSWTEQDPTTPTMEQMRATMEHYKRILGMR